MPAVLNPILLEMPPTPFNYSQLAGKLRQEDVEECHAMGWPPHDALWFALADCPTGCFAVGSLVRRPNWQGISEGYKPEIVGAYGYNRRGNIWSLWAPLGLRETKMMLRHSNAAIQSLLMRAGVDSLWNMVSLRNKGAMEWIARCPAITIDRTKEVRYGDIPFAPFVARRLS